jgi:hypothetical protein
MDNRQGAIVVFAYKRPEHLEKCLNSVLAADRSGWDSVHVYIDGPKNSNDSEDVFLTRKIAHRFLGRIENLEIHTSESNRGLSNSIISSLNEITSSADYFCVIEDDLEIDPNFFSFMHFWLRQNLNEMGVGSVTGYSYVKPIASLQESVFRVRRHSSWGWGTTSEIWNRVDWSILRRRDLKLNWRLWLMGPDMLSMVRSQENGDIDSWSIRFDAFMASLGAKCIMPTTSFVINNGWDGSGTHSEKRLTFKTKNPNWELLSEQGLKVSKSAILNLQIWLTHSLGYKIAHKFVKLSIKL